MVTPIFAALGAILAIILLDTLLGVLLSIRAGTLDVRKLPQFMVTNLLPYAGGLLILALGACIAGEYSTQLLAIFYAAAAATGVKFIAETKDKVVQIFGGAIDEEVLALSVDLKTPVGQTIKEAIIEALQKQTTASK